MQCMVEGALEAGHQCCLPVVQAHEQDRQAQSMRKLLHNRCCCLRLCAACNRSAESCNFLAQHLRGQASTVADLEEGITLMPCSMPGIDPDTHAEEVECIPIGQHEDAGNGRQTYDACSNELEHLHWYVNVIAKSP